MAAGDVYKVLMQFEDLQQVWRNAVWLQVVSDPSGDPFEEISDALRTPGQFISVWRDLVGSDVRWTCNQVRRVDPAPQAMRSFFFSEPVLPIPGIPSLPAYLGALFEFWSGADEPTGFGTMLVSGLSSLNTRQGRPNAFEVLNYDDFCSYFHTFLSGGGGFWRHVLPRTDHAGFDEITACHYRAEVKSSERRIWQQCI